MTAKVSVGIRLPSVHNVDMEQLRAFVMRAEELGVDSIWVGDHVYHHVDVLQPLHMLTWVAALTKRVRLGTAVMLTAYMNPVLLAKAIASVDYISGGRLQLGISIGGTEAEYAGIGVPMNQRVGRLIENVAIMRALWFGENVTYNGKYNNVIDGNINPKPVQQPGVPLYFGANGEPMLRRAARIADGYVGSSGSGIGTFNQNVAYFRNAARELGRDVDELYVGKLQGVSVHTDAATARELAAAQWQSYYGPRFDVDRGTIHGTPDAVAARLAEFKQTDAPAVTAILEPPTLDLDLLALLWQTATDATS